MVRNRHHILHVENGFLDWIIQKLKARSRSHQASPLIFHSLFSQAR